MGQLSCVDFKNSAPSLKVINTSQKAPKPEGLASFYFPLVDLPSVNSNPAMRKAFRLMENVAQSPMTVLLLGESGVGKEVFAKTLHQLSNRRIEGFVPINCGSIPENLLEAELFGSEKGSYTGSLQKRLGKFEMAQTGTLFLDEIGELDLSLQVKLLRVIQEKEFYRIGGDQKVKLDVRIVAATNRDLRQCVHEKIFREDLFYRLNVIALRIPPLRERPEDILVLAQHILKHFQKDHPERNLVLTQQALQQLLAHPWPGNIRELENTLVRSAFLAEGNALEEIHFEENFEGFASTSTSTASSSTTEFGEEQWSQIPLTSLKDMERQLIRKALQASHGSRVKASELLGISDRTLRNKLRLYREEAESLSMPSKVVKAI